MEKLIGAHWLITVNNYSQGGVQTGGRRVSRGRRSWVRLTNTAVQAVVLAPPVMVSLYIYADDASGNLFAELRI